MLLALDVGNTQTVIGIFDRGAGPNRAARSPGELPELAHSWRVATLPDRTADELALLFSELLRLSGVHLPRRAEAPGIEQARVDGLALSSSVPAVTAAVREMVARWFELPLLVVEPGIRMGMPILYDTPKDVGADRIVNAVAALDLFGPPAIVVDLGTSTNFDVISPSGEYLGGVLTPGLEISMEALFTNTARLRRVELAAPKSVIGRSTVDSMQSGAIFGHAAMIDGLCDRIIAELGEATLVTTGGLAGLVTPHLTHAVHLEPWLTLHGLRLLYEQNQTGVGR